MKSTIFKVILVCICLKFSKFQFSYCKSSGCVNYDINGIETNDTTCSPTYSPKNMTTLKAELYNLPLAIGNYEMGVIKRLEIIPYFNLDSMNKKQFYQGLPRNITELIVKHSSQHVGLAPSFIEKAKFKFLSKVPHLESLEIWYFNFETLEEKFRFNPKLKVLFLSLNDIKFVPEDSFAALENLEWISLSNNDITILCEKLLQSNKKLKKVWFSHNEIKRIPENFFSGLTDLEEVEFQHNKIEYLPGKLFLDTAKIRNIWFFNNRIKKLSPKILKFEIIHFTRKFFHENPCSVGGNFNVESDLSKCFEEWNQSPTQVEVDYDDASVCGATGEISMRDKDKMIRRNSN